MMRATDNVHPRSYTVKTKRKVGIEMTLKEYFKVSVPSIGMYRGVTFYYRTAEVDGIKLVIPDSVETEVFIEYGGREYKLVFRDMAQTIPKELEEYDGRIWQV